MLWWHWESNVSNRISQQFIHHVDEPSLSPYSHCWGTNYAVRSDIGDAEVVCVSFVCWLGSEQATTQRDSHRVSEGVLRTVDNDSKWWISIELYNHSLWCRWTKQEIQLLQGYTLTQSQQPSAPVTRVHATGGNHQGTNYATRSNVVSSKGSYKKHWVNVYFVGLAPSSTNVLHSQKLHPNKEERLHQWDDSETKGTASSKCFNLMAKMRLNKDIEEDNMPYHDILVSTMVLISERIFTL